MDPSNEAGEASLPASDKISVLVIDDRPIIRSALAALLGTYADLRVDEVASVDDGALALAREPTDVVLVGDSADVNAIKAFSRSAIGRPRVVVLGAFANGREVERTLSSGACGVVSFRGAAENLVTAIRCASTGRRYACPLLLAMHLDEAAEGRSSEPPPPRVPVFTRREREVLASIVDGSTDRQIGIALGLSIKTIHTYRTRIMEKMGVNCVALLVRRTLEMGLVSGAERAHESPTPSSVILAAAAE
jgi:DNA-binding NarL/FixJ family response regulator